MRISLKQVSIPIFLFSFFSVYSTGPPFHDQLRYFMLYMNQIPSRASFVPNFACSNLTLPLFPQPLDVKDLCSKQGLVPRIIPAVLYDAVLFSTEVNLLLTRLVELLPVVDKFIVLESPVTFSGSPKSLVFQKNAHCFATFGEKLVSDIVYGLPISDGTWAAEAYMRNYMVKTATQLAMSSKSGVHPVLLATSDLDELPSRNAMATVKFCKVPTPSEISMSSFYYNLRWQFSDPWTGTRIQEYPFESSSEVLRHTKGLNVIHGGWHMSYFMNVSQIQKKLASFSHTEYNRWPYNTEAWIADAIAQGKSLFNDEHLLRKECKLESIPIITSISIIKDWLCG